MAIEIVLKDLVPIEILEIVESIKVRGCRQGVDFDFAYTPERLELFYGDSYKRFTTFKFYNEPFATWFIIKYSKHL